MACTGISCNQGRAGCDPTCENSKPRRSCAVLGVCQGRTPPCSDACENPAMRLNTDNSDGSDPYGEARELIDLALDFALAVLAVGCVIFTVFSLI